MGLLHCGLFKCRDNLIQEKRLGLIRRSLGDDWLDLHGAQVGGDLCLDIRRHTHFERRKLQDERSEEEKRRRGGE